MVFGMLSKCGDRNDGMEDVVVVVVFVVGVW